MKQLFKRRKGATQPPSRITNETVAEHRERILAGGRRFKYPMQYARHKLVINTIIISVIVLITLVTIAWWQLYIVQNTNMFFYRITRVIPVPVAAIDGEPVRYSDYLMNYNSSIHYLQQKEQVDIADENGKRLSDSYKGISLDLVMGDAYAAKLARERGIIVSDKEVEAYIDAQRQARDGTVSKETYDAVILDYYGWSPSEYQHVMKNKLIRQRVAYDIDTDAKARMEKVATAVAKDSSDMQQIADSAGGEGKAKVVYVAPGPVPVNNQDGGLSEAAAKLSPGQVSQVIKSTTGDGYYFVKLIDKSGTQINYTYIQVPLTALSNKIKSLQADHKVTKYIKVEDVDIGSTNQ